MNEIVDNLAKSFIVTPLTRLSETFDLSIRDDREAEKLPLLPNITVENGALSLGNESLARRRYSKEKICFAAFTAFETTVETPP